MLQNIKAGQKNILTVFFIMIFANPDKWYR